MQNLKKKINNIYISVLNISNVKNLMENKAVEEMDLYETIQV